ncbi:rhamnogalacturonan acetylesterase [Saccharothrix sp. ST-888]|uniref:rhamnogalacturonan acetylesterase n=1 Tax=Saccharothrix sp. ST-888 TaxID=1427391 RepID=UPI0018CF5075|nr:rhamnogalacturonan acetylesterase [Saccharothrix sp. ST-888]
MTGWGQTMQLFLHPEIEVVNCARHDTSSRSFADSGRLQWILDQLIPGDYLLVSFALGDKKTDAERHTKPFGSYQDQLRRYIEGARDRLAHPVLVTGHERRTFDPHGNLRWSLGQYAMAMRELAAQTCTPLVDLHAQSLDWWNQLGPEGTKQIFLQLEPGEHPNHPEGVSDDTQLRPVGAVECSRFVTRSLAEQGIVPPHWVVNLETPQFPPEALGWLDDATYEALAHARTVPTGTVR